MVQSDVDLDKLNVCQPGRGFQMVVPFRACSDRQPQQVCLWSLNQITRKYSEHLNLCTVAFPPPTPFSSITFCVISHTYKTNKIDGFTSFPLGKKDPSKRVKNTTIAVKTCTCRLQNGFIYYDITLTDT